MLASATAKGLHMSLFKKLLCNSRGTAAVELGLVLCLIVIGIFGPLNGLGNEATKSFTSTAQKVQQATS